MKTIKIHFLLLASVLLLLGSCEGPFSQIDESIDDVELKKGSAKTSVVLTEADSLGILFMREEEKLAHDVYEQLYADFGHPIFLNIATSEQKHMDAMLRLITYYKLEDSATEVSGQFNNEELQTFYNDLMASITDLTSALNAGILIENADIEDITGLIEITDLKNVKQVYSHLLNGSYNHLSSFQRILDKLESKQN